MKFRTKLVYFFNHILKYYNRLNIMSTKDSIQYLLDNKCSLARYGDGEMNIMMGGSIHFQDYNEELSTRLKLILREEQNKIKIGIPLSINTTDGYNLDSKSFWNMNMSTGRIHWYRYCSQKENYLNASMTRCYIDYEDKDNSTQWFNDFMKLWENLDILIVEGSDSKLGVNNSLFSNAKLINRIICPSKNAFNKYKEILDSIKENYLDYDLILVSLGPTATVLCYDLSHLGIRAIDIGHLNLEFNKYIEDQIKQYNNHIKDKKISLDNYENQIIKRLDI